MKWSIFVCLVVCTARFCDGFALKCPPGVTDSSCTEERIPTNTEEPSNSESSEAQCLAGSEWESNCHYCRCSSTGLAECSKLDICDKGAYAEPLLCKPNTTFQRDCNTCVCLENGLGLCTLSHCSRPDSPVPTHEVIEESLSEFSEPDVPTLKSGHTDAVVQKKKLSTQKNATKIQVCEANRMFIKDCNTCWCNEDGTGYFCTRRVCVPLHPDDEQDIGGIPAEDLKVIKKECRPDEVFELDCNMCRCNPDGKSYSCTRRACEEHDDKKKVTLSRKVRAFTPEPPKACQPGQEFRMDCNKCLCDNKGQDFSCTRIDCNALNNNHNNGFSGPRTKRESSPSQQVGEQCAAGSMFERGCNVCRCGGDARSAVCTLRRCEPAPARTPDADPGFRCNPGEQFKRDCNDCTCSADGKSVFCTLRLCDQDLTPDI
ncbi:uncharacterized protein LOC113494310 isoform X1 [Trichoplusia ni]|uniref:Uncharacterized protein LOC113494310 isoform X1 n=1 Tax=Trichoplusia ni TaxID=7111 RepID=A0A7E5VJC3_TRINI|nr:uncharacterized protein LOC113494310 isoform X1 [Trichoplusia ni]